MTKNHLEMGIAFQNTIEAFEALETFLQKEKRGQPIYIRLVDPAGNQIELPKLLKTDMMPLIMEGCAKHLNGLIEAFANL